MKKHSNKYLKDKNFNANLNKFLDRYKYILSFKFWDLLNKNKNKYLNYLNQRYELLKEIENLDWLNKQKFLNDIVWSFKDKIMLFREIQYIFDDEVFCEISPTDYMKKCENTILNFCEYTFEFQEALNETKQKLTEIKKMKQSNNSIFQFQARSK